MTQENALQTINDESIEDQDIDQSKSEQDEGDAVKESDSSNDPAGFTKRINQKHFELMEEKRAREAVEAEIIALKARMPENHKVEIPPLPDPYDDDYDVRIAQRDEAIKKVAIYEAQESVRQNHLEEQHRSDVESKRKALAESVKTYSGRARNLNISESELKVAGQTVAAYGIHDSVAEFILQDEKGPAITAHLARNPEQLEIVSKLNPIQAALYIASNVKPKLSSKTKADELPDPPETLSGGGVSKKERGPKGAKYE